MASLAEPAFPGDDGAVYPALAHALTAYDGDHALAPVLVALGSARVLVPVVAVRGESAVGSDKEADMATVMMTGADGRQALLAFSALETLQCWRPDARPVPVWAREAASAALGDGATALLLDLAGPVRVVVETDDLRHLAAGDELVAVGGSWAWTTAA
ncbi:SseB family protein [Mumia sp. ZJ1417]|uniref:SseB family protein n=1 Tax=Mumia sp. ZJ1417 TaxID=2708082 RepID=UPI001423EA74|nr:SseB family protein [Mumia sp. ZJ1417]QMW68000.1 SseB family protein [Mumia sp. ZJ1417]